MSWPMEKLYIIAVALVLCGFTNGFSVLSKASVIDWQAGRLNATWNRNVQPVSPVRFLELHSRKGVRGNVGGGSSVMRASRVQTAQLDSSFQPSGSSVHGRPELSANSRAAPIQNIYSSQSSGHWYQSHKPNANSLPSQSWPIKELYVHGFQNPSFSQSAGTTNQVSGSQTWSLYQPLLKTQISESQNAPISLTQSSDSSVYQRETFKRYNTSQTLNHPSSSQNVVDTNNTYEFNPQLSYQPGITTQALAGPSATFPDESLGISALYPSQTSSRYTILQGPVIPTTSQGSGYQIQSLNQPSTITQAMTGQAHPYLAQSSDMSTLDQGFLSGGYLTDTDPIIPSTSQGSGFQAQLLNQPSYTTQVLTAPSQPQGTNKVESSSHAKWYTLLHGQAIPSSSQVSGFQTLISNRPDTTTPVLAGSSVSMSPGQVLSPSTLYEGQVSSRYNISEYQNIPSYSQTGITRNRIYGIRNQSSYWPSSTTLVSPSNSASTSQTLSMGASTLHQSLADRRNQASLYQSIPSSLQSIVTTNQISGLQTQSSYQLSSTPYVVAGQVSSTSQTQSRETSTQGYLSRHSVSQEQNITSDFPSVPITSQVSTAQTQSSHQPSTAIPALTGQSASASQSSEFSIYRGFPPSVHRIPQGQMIPSTSQVSGFQTQSLYQPSTTATVLTDQSASSLFHPSGASTLIQGFPSGRYQTSRAQSIPSLSQSGINTDQISRVPDWMFQWNTTQALVGQAASTAQDSNPASKLHVMNPFSSYMQTKPVNISPLLNQSLAMPQINVPSPAFNTHAQFLLDPQTDSSSSVSLFKPAQQTQDAMVQNGTASIVASQNFPHAASTSQSTGSYAAEGPSQNLAGAAFQHALPQVGHDKRRSLCNFPLGFCTSSQAAAASNKDVQR